MNCMIIGEGSMPVLCAKTLVKTGFQIAVTCSPDAPLREWSDQRRILHTSDVQKFFAEVRAQRPDYLFSIVNYDIIPADVLAAPRKCAVNFHDGPLPRYAGVFATSWAIYNGETSHAITWHVMTPEVDAGDILLQVPVTIAANENSESLNRKCWFAGIQSFSKLARQLFDESYTRKAQDLSQRTVYRFKDWPPQEESASLERALQFGQSGERLLQLHARHTRQKNTNTAL